MSCEYTNVVFLKVDVDKAKEVAAANKIRAMPTFKLFKGKAEEGSVQGFSEPKIIAMLEKGGALKAAETAASAKEE